MGAGGMEGISLIEGVNLGKRGLHHSCLAIFRAFNERLFPIDIKRNKRKLGEDRCQTDRPMEKEEETGWY